MLIFLESGRLLYRWHSFKIIEILHVLFLFQSYQGLSCTVHDGSVTNVKKKNAITLCLYIIAYHFS